MNNASAANVVSQSLFASSPARPEQAANGSGHPFESFGQALSQVQNNGGESSAGSLVAKAPTETAAPAATTDDPINVESATLAETTAGVEQPAEALQPWLQQLAVQTSRDDDGKVTDTNAHDVPETESVDVSTPAIVAPTVLQGPAVEAAIAPIQGGLNRPSPSLIDGPTANSPEPTMAGLTVGQAAPIEREATPAPTRSTGDSSNHVPGSEPGAPASYGGGSPSPVSVRIPAHPAQLSAPKEAPDSLFVTPSLAGTAATQPDIAGMDKPGLGNLQGEALKSNGDITLSVSEAGKPVMPQGAVQAQRMNDVALDQSASPHPAPMARELSHPEWSEEFGGRIVWMAGQGLQNAQLKIHPDHLGPIEIRLKLDHDMASVQFIAAHAQVREAVESALPKLRDMLNEHQLTLADVSIGAEAGSNQRQAQDSANPFRQGQAWSGSAGGYGADSGQIAEGISKIPAAADTAASTTLLNLYA